MEKWPSLELTLVIVASAGAWDCRRAFSGRPPPVILNKVTTFAEVCTTGGSKAFLSVVLLQALNNQ